MTINEVKRYVDALVKEFFAGANVIWFGQSLVHRGNPAVMLRLRNIQTAPFPVTEWQDGDVVENYHGTAILEVNLFTDGRIKQEVKQMVMPRENTVVNDLTGFQLFLGSDYVSLKNSKGNVNITPLGPVNDVSAIRDNTEREYSAMQEYIVNFVTTVQGFAGARNVSGGADNSSGGVPETLQRLEAGCFENVEIK